MDRQDNNMFRAQQDKQQPIKVLRVAGLAGIFYCAFLLIGVIQSKFRLTTSQGPMAAQARFPEVAEAFAPWRKINRRDAWRPKTKAKRGDAADSKFGGIPLLGANEKWPTCSGCRRPMQLFLQIDIASAPPGSFPDQDSGVLQLLHCMSDPLSLDLCEAELGTWEPFSKGKLLRIVNPNGAQLSAPAIPYGFTPIPSQIIVGWDRFDDYPYGMEHERLGLKYEYQFAGGGATVNVKWPAGNVAFDGLVQRSGGPGVDEAIGSAAEQDKLGGWPRWVQGVEYPQCPRCGREMSCLFQIDSNDHLPYMFGDVGCGHITQCREHPEVLAFGWACS